MGLFSNLKDELGANTGKWVSNKVFGQDGWSTPQRINVGISNNDNGKDSFAKKQAEIEERRLEIEEERLLRQEKMLAEKEREKKFEELSSFNVGNTKEEISESLNYLFAISNSQKDKNLRKICMEKIDYGIMKLRSAGGVIEADFFGKKLEEANKKKGFFGFLK